MRILSAKNTTVLTIGKAGENLAVQVRFPVADEWRKHYGTGTFTLLHRRSGDSAPYPVTLIEEGDDVVWAVTSTDTARSGIGNCELRYTVGDTIVKSVTYAVKVKPSLGDTGETPPEPWESWVDEVLDARDAVEEAMQDYRPISKTAAMTQPVGRDTDGKLWTEPTGGGGVVPETDPTVPSWAKQADKPTYTAAEVGALPDNTPIPNESTVSGWGFTKNTGTYSKPSGGIPKTDLASSVQTSLDRADTALQQHQSLSAYRTASAQDEIDDGKVDKVTGKGLSTNDYTTTEKNKLAGLSNYTLPTASASTKGGVKIGAGLTMDGDTLNATGGRKIISATAVMNGTTCEVTPEFTPETGDIVEFISPEAGLNIANVLMSEYNFDIVDGRGRSVLQQTGFFGTNSKISMLVDISTNKLWLMNIAMIHVGDSVAQGLGLGNNATVNDAFNAVISEIAGVNNLIGSGVIE